MVARPENSIFGVRSRGKREGQEDGSGEVIGVSLEEGSGFESDLRV